MAAIVSPPPSVAYVKYHNTTAGFAIVAQVSISSAQPPSREMPGEYTISFFVTPLQKSYSCLPLVLLQYLNKNLKKKKKKLSSVNTPILFLYLTGINSSCFITQKCVVPIRLLKTMYAKVVASTQRTFTGSVNNNNLYPRLRHALFKGT